MPKQKLNIFQKLRMSYWFIIGKTGFGLIESCGVCGSLKLRRKKVRDDKRIYRAQYKCIDCGSVARVKEKWRSGGFRNEKVRN